MDKPKKNSGKFYEGTIFKIYKELEPHADVRINDMLEGRDTGIKRQIDVSVRAKIADHDILIIIQAKDHNKAADVKIVGEFSSVIKDVGAQKGIIICKSGFTKSAITHAKNLKIDLLSVSDAITDNILINYKFPTVKESILIDWNEFKIEVDEIVDGKLIDGFLTEDIVKTFFVLPLQTQMFGETTLISQFYKQWDINNLCKDPHKYNFFLQGGTFVYNHRQFKISDFNLTFATERKFHLKYISIFEYKLMKNFMSGTDKNFTVFANEAIPFLNDGTWEEVLDDEFISIFSPGLHLEIFNFQFAAYRRFNFSKTLDMKEKIRHTAGLMKETVKLSKKEFHVLIQRT